jgi:hypothetical protein
MNRRQSRTAAFVTLAGILIVGVAVAARTAGDYGVGWDDYVQSRYGDLVLDYFLSGGANRACNELLDLKFYAPAFELVAAAVCGFAPDKTVEIRHLLTALTALLAAPALWKTGRLLGNPWLGVAASLALFLTPAFYGHAFINSKDIPFAVGFAWSMYALAAMFARGQFRWTEILAAGVAFGLTVSVRPGGWVLLLAVYIPLAVWCDWRERARARTRGETLRRRRTLLKQACLLLVAWTIMVLPWPWAHANPWSHPLQAIRLASQFHVVVPVLFEGQVLPSNELPRYYLLKYLLITMPPALLVFAAIGLAVAPGRIAHKLDSPRAKVLLVLAIWLVLPIALFVAARPNAYDGLRHFLFLIPALAMWAAIGGEALWKRCSSNPARLAMAALLVVAVGTQVASLIRLHPYQSTYFNFLVGGVRQAGDRYDTETWLTSYKEAIEWIQRQPALSDEPIDVLVAANDNSRWCADAFAGERLRITTTLKFGQAGDLPAGIEYYVGTSRSGMDKNFPLAPVVCRIGREGALFTAVRQASADYSAASK